jgi:hypothetical protein
MASSAWSDSSVGELWIRRQQHLILQPQTIPRAPPPSESAAGITSGTELVAARPVWTASQTRQRTPSMVIAATLVQGLPLTSECATNRT